MSINPYESPQTPAGVASEPPRPIWEEIEIEYEVAFDDFVAFNVVHSQRMPWVRSFQTRLSIFAALAIPLGIMVYLMYSGTPADSPDSLLLLLYAFVALVLFLFLGWRSSRARMGNWLSGRMIRSALSRGDYSSVLGMRRLKVTGDWIEEFAPLRESRWRLPAVQKIVVTSQHAYIYVSPNQAFIVPARAFSSLADFAAFIANLEGHTGKTAERWN